MSRLSKGLVKVQVEPPITQDGEIYIQEEWQSHPPVGEVLAVAEGVTACKVGDTVFFERYTSIAHPLEKDVRICREDAIIEVLDEK